MVDQKKFLDAEGVKYLWSKINMQDYPNNETLMGVIEAIDETKADKSDLVPMIEERQEKIIVFNGEIEGLEVFNKFFYKVSNDTPTLEELITNGYYFVFGAPDTEETYKYTFEEMYNNGYIYQSSSGLGYNINNFIYVVTTASENGPSTGIYFEWAEWGCAREMTYPITKKVIDPNYIDDSFATKEYVDALAIPKTDEAHKVLTTNADGEIVWEDKLCYSYREEYLVHPGYTIPKGQKMVYMASVPIVSPIAEGETYSVIWDDQEYICVAYASASFGIALGNESLISANYENTNEPFFLAGWQEFNMAQVFFAADTNGHTFKEVKGIKDFYVPIDGNYIAGGVYPGSGAASTVIGTGQATGTGSISVNAGRSHGTQTFAEGFGTVHENSTWGHAEGGYTHVYGDMGHAEGYGTISHGIAQHVQGTSNIPDEECKYAHIVGNGEGINDSNAHTLDWEGNAWFAGDVYVSSTSGTNKDEGSKKLATEEYVNELIASIEIATDDEIIDMLIKEDIIAAVVDSDGVLADENNDILLW